jgi:hypothetical protein
MQASYPKADEYRVFATQRVVFRVTPSGLRRLQAPEATMRPAAALAVHAVALSPVLATQ